MINKLIPYKKNNNNLFKNYNKQKEYGYKKIKIKKEIKIDQTKPDL